MMKINTSILLFLLMFDVGFGQKMSDASENHAFKPGQIAHLFGDDVQLRGRPNPKSDVVATLAIGQRLEIIEKSDSNMKFEGMQSPWYKVKTNDQVGFVLGTLIALHNVRHENLTYLVSLKKEGSQLFAKTRVLENGLNFKENVTPIEHGKFSIRATGNKGLESVQSIFHIDYLAEACGVNNGGVYFFYDGKHLRKAIEYTEISEAALFSIAERYIFPNEEGGREGKIVYRRELEETKDEETEWTETKITQRILHWNGRKMIPKITLE